MWWPLVNEFNDNRRNDSVFGGSGRRHRPTIYLTAISLALPVDSIRMIYE